MVKYALVMSMVSCMAIAQDGVSSGKNQELTGDKTPRACDLSVAVKAEITAKMPLLVVQLGTGGVLFESIVKHLAKDLSCDLFKQHGFAVSYRKLEKLPDKQEITKLAGADYQLILFLSTQDEGESLEWRIYDTRKLEMICGKKVSRKGRSTAGFARSIADVLMGEFTGTQGCFSSYLAYCKEETRGKKAVKNIYCMPAFAHGVHEHERIVDGGRLLAPRWKPDVHEPTLLFSCCSDTNIALMALDGQRRCKVVSNFDGINMLPSFSTDGSRVVYCLSCQGSTQIYSYEFDPLRRSMRLKKLTDNQGNNVSPVLTKNGDIIFCSDYATGRPELYCLRSFGGALERLTFDGWSMSPAACQAHDKIAYIKAVKGITQLFTYDSVTGNSVQLTFDDTNKEEPSWSPCGTFIALSVEQGSSSRIALLNTITMERVYVTPAGQRCTYPTWSGRFPDYPLTS